MSAAAPAEAYKLLPDMTPLEVACAVPLLAMTVILGVAPQPFISIIEPSLDQVVRLATDPSFTVLAAR